MAKKNETEKQIIIQKLYVKDFSFESPNTPDVFSGGEWNPKTNLNLRSSHNVSEDDLHEVILTITVEAKDEDKTIFLVEIQQAGLFYINGYTEEEVEAIVGSFCPSQLFPFARETIGGIISKGGFPEFLLQPINFDALFAEAKKQIHKESNDGDSKKTSH